MGLHTDAVDDALFLEVLCHFDDGVHLAVHILVVVVVVELAALGGVLSRKGECLFDE